MSGTSTNGPVMGGHHGARNAGVVSRSTLLLGAVTAFLIAPKINVIGVLRVEDFVFLMTLPVLMWSYRTSGARAPDFFYWYVGYLAIALLSVLLNYGNVGIFGVINVLRQVQYVIWFVVGAQMALGVSEGAFRKSMSFVAVVLILWWAGEASGVLPKIGKFAGASERVTLNTSGPYETAVVVTFLLIFVRNRGLQIGLIGILFATQSRITLAAAVAIYIALNLRKSLIFALPLMLLLGGLMVIAPDIPLFERLSATATPLQMLQVLLRQIEVSPVITSLGDYEYFAYTTVWNQIGQSASDASFTMRTIRWALVIKSLQSDWPHLLFGWGPGAWGSAVDGHYVRFVGETGLIGLASILTFLVCSVFARQSPRSYRIAVLLMIGSALFIDVFTSSKAMSFLWVILGYSYNRLSSLDGPATATRDKHKWRMRTAWK